MTLHLAASVAATFACLTACTPTPPPADELCREAAAHLTECFGIEPAATACDPAASSMVIGQTCAELADAGKADVFGSALCGLGVLSQCPVEACEVNTPATTCAEYIDREDCSQCDYYLCRDAAAPESCGDSGYYRGFGFEYCERYLEVTTPLLSPEGQQFAHDVRRCLMRAMERDIAVDAGCDAAKTAAYDSHPPCYVEAGFCALPLTDWLTIAATISPEDLSFKQVLDTATACTSARLTGGSAQPLGEQ